MLSKIVGTGVLDGPCVELLPYGRIAEKYINQLNDFYNDIFVKGYVIMPNHIHIMLYVRANSDGLQFKTPLYSDFYQPLRDLVMKNMVKIFGNIVLMTTLSEIVKITMNI